MLFTTFVQGTGDSSTNSGLLFKPGRVSDSPRHIQQEPFGLQITQQTAVKGQREVHARAVVNPIACTNSAERHCADAQDNSLILIEHGEGKQAGHTTNIGERRDSACHFIRSQTMRTGTSNEIGLGVGKRTYILLVRIAYYRDNEAFLQRNSNPDMHGISRLSLIIA